MLFHFLLELLLQIRNQFFQILDFPLFDIQFFLDLYFLLVEAAVFLSLLARQVVDGFLVVFPLVFEFGGDCVERPS